MHPKVCVRAQLALGTLREYYTTPVAFISAIVLDWFICIVEVSDSQKQCINDAFQYVAVPPIPPKGVGMNDAKLQKVYEIQTYK